MKKINILFSILLTVVVFTMNSCEKKYSTEDLSRLTYFPDFEMSGSPELYITLGESFTDPGVVATENGQEINLITTITGDYFGNSGSVNTNAEDRYIINYTAINSDGYPGFTEREVYVVNTGDLTTSISGLYTSTIVRNGSSSAQYTDLSFVMIAEVSSGVYALSDAIGGYYDLGRGYGSGYRATGIEVTVNDLPGNDFSFTGPVGVGLFGGVLTMSSMSVDAGAKTLSFTSEWDAGYTFEVTLTQVQL